MREAVVREFSLKVSTILPTQLLEQVCNELCVVLDDYDVTKRCTEIALQKDILPEEVKMYLVSLDIEGRSKNTTKNYLLTLKDFFAETRKSLYEISQNDIRVYLYRYEQRKNVCKATVEQKRIILRGFFEWCANENILASNPARSVKPIKYEKHERQPLTQIELEQIRKACKTLREKAIVEVLYSTGCRVSELCWIKLSDINLKDSEVKLFGKGSKHRMSYINARANIAITDYINSRSGQSEYLICSDRKPYGGMHKEGIEKIIRNIMDRVGGEVAKHVTPHVFRHTTATQALESGMPVEEISTLLGHVELNTTMIYAKTSRDKVKTDHRKYVI